MKLCKDCNNFTRDILPQCSHQNNTSVVFDYVDGERKKSPIFWQARYLRENDQLCGPAGVWFEARKPIGAESEKFLYADEDEPDRYRNEDQRLDDPRHDQCVGGKFKEKI